MSIEKILDGLIRREGSKVTDHRLDGGGLTKYGITLLTLEEYYRAIGARPLSTVELRQALVTLTEMAARAIYHRLYIIKPGFEGITDLMLRELVVDTGVLHGRRRASRWLQMVVDVAPDGHVGPITLGVVNYAVPRAVYIELLARRYRGFADFVQSRPSQVRWLEGWMNRANEFLMRLK